MFSCDFVTFLYVVPGQLLYLIESILIFAIILTFDFFLSFQRRIERYLRKSTYVGKDILFCVLKVSNW